MIRQILIIGLIVLLGVLLIGRLNHLSIQECVDRGNSKETCLATFN